MHSLKPQIAQITIPATLSSTSHIHTPASPGDGHPASLSPHFCLLLQTRATADQAMHRSALGCWNKQDFPNLSSRSTHSITLLLLHAYPAAFAFHGLLMQIPCALGCTYAVVPVSLWNLSLCISASSLSLPAIPLSCLCNPVNFSSLFFQWGVNQPSKFFHPWVFSLSPKYLLEFSLQLYCYLHMVASMILLVFCCLNYCLGFVLWSIHTQRAWKDCKSLNERKWKIFLPIH